MANTPLAEPYEIFREWFAEAQEREPNDANAMALATADAQGRPSVRMVLMKAWDEAGFVFYTNLESRKGRELAENPNVALLFHWKSLRRQVRIEGPALPVTEEEADAYFASRPRDSQIGAWASAQSRPLDGRATFLGRIAQEAARFGLGTVPRPPFWSGFRVAPERIEFWEDRAFRLHERRFFVRGDAGWSWTYLYP
ncbi:pyridoxamine 5'-phosphate oxidase [Pedomonas mirosovicensis]|uniref:pyridoxamine 5'-phosphate oxidase n=1 Tax=Pedomonas mirosovicensis TaxID=2908641 RepID=UPI002168CC67|nr:pyridoxamine 5'-phosphate oxidase [Pedomonas mirosovicensis]MCH8684916.1 pyridoxamine 5'-phosphate oxidase [Pedomonas mirosovicensis]